MENQPRADRRTYQASSLRIEHARKARARKRRIFFFIEILIIFLAAGIAFFMITEEKERSSETVQTQTAVSGKGTVVNSEKLEKALLDAESIKTEAYTAESAALLEEKIKEADDCLGKKEVTSEELETAYMNLMEAIQKLR